MNRRGLLKFVAAAPFAGLLPFRAASAAAPVVMPFQPGGVLAYAYLPMPYKGGEWPLTKRMVIDGREVWVRPDLTGEELEMVRSWLRTTRGPKQ